jgi:hypothetical protein
MKKLHQDFPNLTALEMYVSFSAMTLEAVGNFFPLSEIKMCNPWQKNNYCCLTVLNMEDDVTKLLSCEEANNSLPKVRGKGNILRDVSGS